MKGRVVVTGGAGMVGRNLAPLLARQGYTDVVFIDRHQQHLDELRARHPGFTYECADLAEPGDWARHYEGAAAAVILQAQISSTDPEEFTRNTNRSTEHVLEAIKKYRVPYIVFASSSVVVSVADDHYTRSKRRQEKQVLEAGVPCVVLRPTLMFGTYDNKHLGWIARFMQKTPVLPVPGHGRYVRQPLYVNDFCGVIASCLAQLRPGEIHNITGKEKIFFIDCLRLIKRLIKSGCLVIPLPYALFYVLLRLRNLCLPAGNFNTDQLKAMVAGDIFEVIDWERMFGVTATPLQEAMTATFTSGEYHD